MPHVLLSSIFTALCLLFWGGLPLTRPLVPAQRRLIANVFFLARQNTSQGQAIVGQVELIDDEGVSVRAAISNTAALARLLHRKRVAFGRKWKQAKYVSAKLHHAHRQTGRDPIALGRNASQAD